MWVIVTAWMKVSYSDSLLPLPTATHSAQVQLVSEATRKKSGRVCRPRPAERAKTTPDLTSEEFRFNFF